MKSITKQQTNDQFEIGVYLMSVRSLHPNDISYKEMSQLLYSEFGVEYSEDEIYNYYEAPTIEEDKLAYKLLMNNKGY